MAAPAAIQGVTSIAQLIKAQQMQKELGPRVNYEIPDEAKRALGLMQGLASSREMPGQAGMQAMMDLQAQKAYGNASRAATSSQDLLGVATALGEQGQENQLNLGIQAAQDYQARQQALYGALGTMAGYQEKKTADRQQDWYERAERAAQMKEAGLQNLMGTATSLGQMGMMGMMYGGGGAGAGGSIADSFTSPSDLPTSIDHTKMSGKNLMKLMMQNRQAAPTTASSAPSAFNFSSPSYGGYKNKLGLDGSYLYPDTPAQPGFYNGIDMNNWRSQSGLYDFKMSPNKSMLNSDDWRSGFFNNIH